MLEIVPIKFPKFHSLVQILFVKVMGYERPMYFKLAKPQSLDLGLLGIDAQEEAESSQEFNLHF